ncbi:MAG TPA: DUF6036 family nucleotidyltransferase [Chloroflexota bacterium]|nr:DUF6036 family nucleotidyltransferase [Chloroflexota bacterium]
MSFRPDVDRSRIDLFLRELGRVYRRPARLYLVGGTTVVYVGLRQTTADIDLGIQVDPAHHGELMRAIADLKDRLSINVEEASPGDFIPLPTGWQDRSPYVGRFGQTDVFHFDYVSTALAKLGRGYEQDLEDVRMLLGAGLLDSEDLTTGFQEIAPKLRDRGRSKAEIAEFEDNLQLVLEQRSA